MPISLSTIVSNGPGVTSVSLSTPTGLQVSGSPVTSVGTLTITYAAGYSIPTNAAQANWNTAYADRNKWDGGATGLVASTGRTSLGATTVGANLFQLANPSAIRFIQVNADNSVSAIDAETFRTNIAAATSSDSLFYVIGGGTAGVWSGSIAGLSAYYEGLTIRLKLSATGASTTTLNINGLGAKTVYLYGTTKLTTHYPAGSVVAMTYSNDNGGCWYSQMFYDTTDDYRIRWQNNITAGTLIHGYQLLMEGRDGKYYPVTVGGTDSTTNTVSTAEFKLGGNMLCYETATDIAANASGGGYYLYQAHYTSSMEYWSNRSTTAWATTNMPIYLVGTVNASGNFILDNSSYTSFLTQTLPTTDDGKVYVQIGLMGNTSDTFRLDIHHPMFEFKNGALRPYSPALTPAEILSGVSSVDGTGSGLDADLLDGQHGSYYLSASSYTAADVLAKIKTVDGSGSGLDADLLDGLSAPSFLRSDAANAVDVRLSSGNGRGVRFWDSDSYKIWMSDSTDVTWGGRIAGDTTSDYNIYFRIDDGTNRGFVFENAYATKLFGIHPDGIRSSVPFHNSTFVGAPTAPTPAANDNSTKLATTAYVDAAVTAGGGGGGGGGMSWRNVSTNTALTGEGEGVTVDCSGGTRDITLPASVAVNKAFAVHAYGGAARIVSNGNVIDVVGAGNNLMVADGETAFLVARAAGYLRIV